MKNILQKEFYYSYKNYLMYIIGINFFIFLLTSFSSSMLTFLAMNPALVVNRFAIWQFVTYMFTHAGLSHIIFNMLALFFFGVQVERRMGSSEFLLFYFFCGIAAGIFSFAFFMMTGNYKTFLLGASGAVYAVLFAYAVFYPDNMIYVMGVFPVRSVYLVMGYTAIEIFSHISNPYSGTANLTHLAGFGFAYIYFMIRLRINPANVFMKRRR